MKFNPHLHVIAAEGYFLNDKFIQKKISFNSKFNRMWRLIISNKFNLSSDRYKYGFYVWYGNIHKLSHNYTGRYVRHPAIANSRIVSYNKEEITFFYKKNNNKIIITKSINNFISSLIQHIPPKQFKIVRYYGGYCRRSR